MRSQVEAAGGEENRLSRLTQAIELTLTCCDIGPGSIGKPSQNDRPLSNRVCLQASGISALELVPNKISVFFETAGMNFFSSICDKRPHYRLSLLGVTRNGRHYSPEMHRGGLHQQRRHPAMPDLPQDGHRQFLLLAGLFQAELGRHSWMIRGMSCSLLLRDRCADQDRVNTKPSTRRVILSPTSSLRK